MCFWNSVVYFKQSEFDSPDEPGSGAKMQPIVVEKIDAIRKDIGEPLWLTSAYRSVNHNKKVGGKQNSSHLSGWAVDVICFTSRMRWKLLFYAIKHGFNRIGIYPTFMHLDRDPSKPQEVIWP